MKYFRIHISPKTKAYFDVYILDSHTEMMTFTKNKLNLSYMPAFQAVCDRTISNNRIGRLFFNKNNMPKFTIEHELIHILISYIRYSELNRKSCLYDYVYNFQTQREEELAYIYPYVKSKFYYKLKTNKSNYKKYLTNKKDFLSGLKFYKWENNNVKAKN